MDAGSVSLVLGLDPWMGQAFALGLSWLVGLVAGWGCRRGTR
jgi:hypothetical protein